MEFWAGPQIHAVACLMRHKNSIQGYLIRMLKSNWSRISNKELCLTHPLIQLNNGQLHPDENRIVNKTMEMNWSHYEECERIVFTNPTKLPCILFIVLFVVVIATFFQLLLREAKFVHFRVNIILFYPSTSIGRIEERCFILFWHFVLPMGVYVL